MLTFAELKSSANIDGEIEVVLRVRTIGSKNVDRPRRGKCRLEQKRADWNGICTLLTIHATATIDVRDHIKYNHYLLEPLDKSYTNKDTSRFTVHKIKSYRTLTSLNYEHEKKRT